MPTPTRIVEADEDSSEKNPFEGEFVRKNLNIIPFYREYTRDKRNQAM